MRIAARDDLDNAIKEFRRFLEKFPDDARYPEVEFHQAYTLHKAGRSDEAVEILVKWIELNPQHAFSGKALFWYGEALASIGRADQARGAWRKLLQLFPKDERAPNALESLAWSHFRAQEWMEALLKLRQLKTKYPDEKALVQTASRLIPECLLRLGRAREALEQFDLLLAHSTRGTTFIEAKFGRASALQALARPEEAAKELYEVIELASDTAASTELIPDALHALAGSLIAADRSSEALKAIEQLERTTSGALIAKRAGLRKGIALEALGKDSEAEEAYVTVLSSPEAASVHGQTAWRLAELRNKMGDKLGAVVAYDRVINLKSPPTLVDQALYNSAVTLGEVNKPADSLARLEALLVDYPDSELAPSALYAAADFLVRLKKVDEAAERYAKFLRLYPTDDRVADVRFRRGWCLNAAGQSAAAREEFEAVLRNESTGEHAAEAAYMLGVTAQGEQKREEAQRYFGVAIEAAPNSEWAAEALWALATDARDASLHAEARRYAGRLIQDIPRSRLAPWALRLCGDMDLTSGKTDSALACFQALISRYPDHELIPAALSGQAWAFLSSGKRRQALEAFQALASSHPDTRFGAEALYRAAVILREDGRTEESERTVAELIKRHPKGRFAESAFLERALALRDKGDLDGALKQLESTEKAFPEGDLLGEVMRERALIYYAKKDREAERSAWQRLVDSFPGAPISFDGYWGLAALGQEDGDYELAVRLYAKAIEVSEGRGEAAGASLQMAGLLARLGKTSEARKAYLRILANYPNAPEAAEATVRAGELALKEGDVAKAVELLMQAESVESAIVPLARALGKAGRGAEAHDLLAKRLAALPEGDAGRRNILLELAKIEIGDGKGSEAEGRLQAVVGESDDELAAEAQYLLGDSLSARGKLAEADRAFYKLLLLYPYEKYYAEARFRIGQINERLKDYPRAREFYREVVREHSTSPYAPRARERLEAIGP